MPLRFILSNITFVNITWYNCRCSIYALTLWPHPAVLHSFAWPGNWQTPSALCRQCRYTHNDKARWKICCCCHGRLPHETSDRSHSIEISQHRESWHGLQIVAKDFFSWCVWVGHFQMPQQWCYTYISTVPQPLKLFWCRRYELPSEDFLLRHWGCHLWHRQLTKHLVDQQTAESDIMVYETTYNWCCVQEWGRYWCT